MDLKIGDKVRVSYPVDNFPGHYGFVSRIIEHPIDPVFINTRLVAVYWPFLEKEICFNEDSLELVE